MDDIGRLIEDNIGFLTQGINVMENLDNEAYARNDHDLFENGVGRHFRHILDHYCGLLDAVDGRIDYDSRRRDSNIESDKASAISIARNTIDGLQALAGSEPDAALYICTRKNQSNPLTCTWTKSTLIRELMFLISHTVHHYAIIALLLRIQGFSTPRVFGIAPSTLAYEETLKA